MFWIIYGISLIGCLIILRALIRDQLEKIGHLELGDLPSMVLLVVVAIIPIANAIACGLALVIGLCVLFEQHEHKIIYRSKKRDD